jgi:translation initiation factor 1
MGKKNKLTFTDGIVYSTNPDFVLEDEQKEEESISPEKQNLRITIRSLKGNKKVTVVYNFVGPESDREELAKTLKSKCACGGGYISTTLNNRKDGEILLQGEFLTKVKAELDKMGYKYKVAGV